KMLFGIMYSDFAYQSLHVERFECRCSKVLFITPGETHPSFVLEGINQAFCMKTFFQQSSQLVNDSVCSAICSLLDADFTLLFVDLFVMVFGDCIQQSPSCPEW